MTKREQQEDASDRVDELHIAVMLDPKVMARIGRAKTRPERVRVILRAMERVNK